MSVKPQGRWTMIVPCPHCGHSVVVSGLGRKRLDIPLKNIVECLSARHSVEAAAKELNCSPAYIFGALKANGLRLQDITKRASK